MGKSKTNVPFQGTEAQKQKLLETIEQHRQEKGALMPVMQAAQEIYGYLPLEVQKIIADELHVPVEEVYGVATFYAQFSLNPKGKYKVSVCLGTACYVKGSGDLFNALTEKLGIQSGECTSDGKYSLEACVAWAPADLPRS